MNDTLPAEVQYEYLNSPLCNPVLVFFNPQGTVMFPFPPGPLKLWIDPFIRE
jgi:hypothetical protein